MNGRTIKILIVAKAGLLLGALALFAVFSRGGSVAAAVAGAKAEEPAAGDTALPQIPEGPMSTLQATQVRNELLFLKRDVEARIASLAQARRAYEKAKGDVEVKLRKIQEERQLLAESLQKEKSAREERLGESVEFFAKMEPRKSASVMEGMDRDLVILLLRKLQPRLVTKIIENMTPAKATEFMEYYTKIRSGREYALMKELGLCQPEGQDAASFWERLPTDSSVVAVAPTAAAEGTPSAGNAAVPTAPASPTPAATGSPAAPEAAPTALATQVPTVAPTPLSTQAPAAP